MPKLNQLSKVERADVCRTIARAAHDVLSKKEDANGVPEGGTFEARMYKKCAELGVIEDDEFFGNSFSAERIEVLKGFVETYDQALELAKVYDEAIADMVENCAADFAMASHVLVRMYCVSRFSAKLHEEGGPFADLRVALCVADEDGDDDENDDNDGSVDEGGSDDDDNDSIVVSTSDEEDEEEEGEEEEEEGEEEEGEEEDNDKDVVEEVQPDDAEEPEGPRKCKKARVEESQAVTDDDEEEE